MLDFIERLNKLLWDLNEINAPIRNTGFDTSTIYNILYINVEKMQLKKRRFTKIVCNQNAYIVCIV